MTRLYENSRAASSQGPKDDVMITEVTNGLIVTRLYENSRAASSQGPKDDVMITEVTNGLIVTRPAKKIEYLFETEKTEQEAQVWNLTKDGPVLQSKAASVPVNKLQEILRFQKSNGRY